MGSLFGRLKITTRTTLVTIALIGASIAAVSAVTLFQINSEIERQTVERQNASLRTAAVVMAERYPELDVQLGPDQRVQRLTLPEIPEFDGHGMIDKVGLLTGETATVFAYEPGNGDFWRRTTNIVKPDGNRAVGTNLGKNGSVYPVITAGETYLGEATILGRDYFTVYEPIFDPAGDVIGILYAGVLKDSLTAIKELVRGEGAGNLNEEDDLRRIIAGGRLYNYQEHSEAMTPEEYVEQVSAGNIKDQVLSFQLAQGFVVRRILKNYVIDPRSRNCATFIEWTTPDHKPQLDEPGKVRLASVQYHMRRVKDWDDFAAQMAFERARTAMVRRDHGAVRELARLAPRFIELMQQQARRYNTHIIAGSHPIEEKGKLFNKSLCFGPDGSYVAQSKLHITPSEARWWGVSAGDDADQRITLDAGETTADTTRS